MTCFFIQMKYNSEPSRWQKENHLVKSVNFTFTCFRSFHLIIHISVGILASHIPRKMKWRILVLVLEELLHTWFFSILTDGRPHTKSMTNGLISTFHFLVSHFSAVTYHLPHRIVLTYINWYVCPCMFTLHKLIQDFALSAETTPTELRGGKN